MPYHYDFSLLDDYIHNTGALHLSGLMDEMLYILMCHHSDDRNSCDYNPASQYYHLRELRNLFNQLKALD